MEGRRTLPGVSDVPGVPGVPGVLGVPGVPGVPRLASLASRAPCGAIPEKDRDVYGPKIGNVLAIKDR